MPPAPPQREAATSGPSSHPHPHSHPQSRPHVPPHSQPSASAASAVSKLQSCRACQQRKRKCDRKQPQCSMCEKRGIECVFGLKLSQRNPQLLTDLVKTLEEKDRRISALEAIIRERLPDLANISRIPTVSLAPTASGLSPDPVPGSSRTSDGQHSSPSTMLGSSPRDLDPGSQILPPHLIASVEEKLRELGIEGPDKVRSRHQAPKVISAISTQLGIHETDDDDVCETPSAASWPPYELALQVVDVFIKTNSMWPFLRRVDLMTDLEMVYPQGAASDPDKHATPLQTYNLFLIFSISCVWLAQRGNGNRIDTSLLRNRALANLHTILHTEPAVRCISALALLSLSAIYDWGGIDHVSITPIVGELVMATELHRQPPANLSDEEKNRRRLLFWGIYSMDRAVAGNIHSEIFFNDKDIITVEYPTQIDPLGSLGEHFEPVAFSKHMMTMWDLTVEVGKHDRKPNVTPEETARLHGRLDEWYARTPRPIGRPTLQGDCPEDDQKTLFDQYYYMLVATLYRPRSLANSPPEQIKMLHEATTTALSICAKIQAQGKLFDNYYQFNSIICLGGTLLCTLLQYGGNPANAHDPQWCANAIEEVRSVQSFISRFCRGWPYARGMSQAFNTLAGRLVDKLSAGLAQTSSSNAPQPYAPLPPEPTRESPLQQHEIDLDAALMEAANTLSVANHRLVPGLETETVDDGWDDWINGSLGPIDSRGMEDTGEVDMETLLATIGGSSGWFNAMVDSTANVGQPPGHQHNQHGHHPPQTHQPHLPHPPHQPPQPHQSHLPPHQQHQHRQHQAPHQAPHQGLQRHPI